MPRRQPTVASFGRRALQLLIEGSKERQSLPFTYREAVAMAQRLNSLRAAMRREGHQALPSVEQAKVRVDWLRDGSIEEEVSSKNVRVPKDRDSPAFLIVEPHDLALGEKMKAAGIPEPDLQDDPLEPRNSGPTNLDDILYGLERRKPV